MKTVLSIDIGTTSLKAAVISPSGEEVSFAQVSYKNPDDRYIALEWSKALADALEKMGIKLNDEGLSVLEKSGEPPVILEAVSISGNGPTVVTEKGLTVRWNENFDFSEDEKTRIHKSLFMPKILGLKKIAPKDFDESETIFSGPEFLVWQLTGEKVTILPESRYESAYWNDDLLKENGLELSKFPPFRKIGECYGLVAGGEPLSAGKRLSEGGGPFAGDKELSVGGRLSGLPVYGAGPDFIAAMIGTGCTETGALCDCAGSSEGFNLCIPVPYSDSRIRLLPSVTPGLWNAAVMIPKSGRFIVEYKSQLEAEFGREVSYSELIDYCFDHPESEGWKILETLLNFSKNALEILKDIAQKCGFEMPSRMFVAGGQAKNARWMKLKAETLGIELEVSRIPDAELLGNWKAAGE